jgi:6-phosphogluconolactonase
MDVRTFDSPEEIGRAAATDFVALAQAAIAERGAFHVALSGGSMPQHLFRALVALGKGAVAWDHVVFWWGDERTVPPDHADSNYGMAKRLFLDPLAPLGVVPARVHRMRGEDEPAAAAAAYERELVAALGTPPLLDYALQGMGPDGHTASLFPGSPGVAVTDRWVIANPVDSPLAHGKTTRLTLTAPALRAARAVRFLVAGADKAPALAAVLRGPRDPARYPSQLVADLAVWFVDKQAMGGHT